MEPECPFSLRRLDVTIPFHRGGLQDKPLPFACDSAIRRLPPRWPGGLELRLRARDSARAAAERLRVARSPDSVRGQPRIEIRWRVCSPRVRGNRGRSARRRRSRRLGNRLRGAVGADRVQREGVDRRMEAPADPAGHEQDGGHSGVLRDRVRVGGYAPDPRTTGQARARPLSVARRNNAASTFRRLCTGHRWMARATYRPRPIGHGNPQSAG